MRNLPAATARETDVDMAAVETKTSGGAGARTHQIGCDELAASERAVDKPLSVRFVSPREETAA